MRRVTLTAPTVIVILLYGCHWPQSRTAQTATPSPPQQLAKVERGQIAPDIDDEDMNGQRLHLADFKGQVVVLHFWANY